MNSETAITIDESRRLIELERKIERGLETFVEVGEALMEIRDKKLYRIEGEKVTFEAYCRDRWKMTRMFAHYQIEGAKTAKNVNNCLQKPQSEGQVRPLTKLESDQQPAAWERAVEIADGEQPTAKQVEQAVTEVLEPETNIEERHSSGLYYAERAISELAKIHAKDTERDQAFRKIIKWINKHYEQ